MFSPSLYLDSTQTEHWNLFSDKPFVWEALPAIDLYFKTQFKAGGNLKNSSEAFISKDVFIGSNVHIAPTAIIEGPAWIGDGCEIRPGAYIRQNVIIGAGSVIGNSCEFKNCILFNGCKIPHFSYVGDSILGAKAHLGAGVICSNFKLDGSPITIKHEGQTFQTGLRKFGAIIGDQSEIGSNTVLNPGSILGRESLIYPGVQWRGVLPEKSIAKMLNSVRVIAKREI